MFHASTMLTGESDSTPAIKEQINSTTSSSGPPHQVLNAVNLLAVNRQELLRRQQEQTNAALTAADLLRQQLLPSYLQQCQAPSSAAQLIPVQIQGLHRNPGTVSSNQVQVPAVILQQQLQLVLQQQIESIIQGVDTSVQQEQSNQLCSSRQQDMNMMISSRIQRLQAEQQVGQMPSSLPAQPPSPAAASLQSSRPSTTAVQQVQQMLVEPTPINPSFNIGKGTSPTPKRTDQLIEELDKVIESEQNGQSDYWFNKLMKFKEELSSASSSGSYSRTSSQSYWKSSTYDRDCPEVDDSESLSSMSMGTNNGKKKRRKRNKSSVTSTTSKQSSKRAVSESGSEQTLSSAESAKVLHHGNISTCANALDQKATSENKMPPRCSTSSNHSNEMKSVSESADGSEMSTVLSSRSTEKGPKASWLRTTSTNSDSEWNGSSSSEDFALGSRKSFNTVPTRKQKKAIQPIAPLPWSQQVISHHVSTESANSDCSKEPKIMIDRVPIVDKGSSPIEIGEFEWNSLLERLQKYMAAYGNCCVPRIYKNDPALAHCCTRLREEKHRLNDKQKKILIDIGFNWSENASLPRQQLWNDMFDRLVEYKRKNGTCRVPTRYHEDPQLGRWVEKQRIREKYLSVKCRKKLDDIGFVWSVYQASWETSFQQLVAFKEQHGHCRVPRKYHKNRQLGKWVDNQRSKIRKNSMDPHRLQLLDSIGFS